MTLIIVVVAIVALIAAAFIVYNTVFLPNTLYPPFKAFQEYVPAHLVSEQHTTETEDGYLLTLVRVVNPEKLDPNRLPVLLQHGLGCSAFNFAISGPILSPAFILADRGFDVWLGNNRGNFFSNKHRTLKNTSPKFYDYSFQEMEFDVLANLKKITETTGLPKVNYIGHSQGTTQVISALTS